MEEEEEKEEEEEEEEREGTRVEGIRVSKRVEKGIL